MLRLFKDELPNLDAERAERLGSYQTMGMTSQLLYLPERPEPNDRNHVEHGDVGVDLGAGPRHRRFGHCMGPAHRLDLMDGQHEPIMTARTDVRKH